MPVERTITVDPGHQLASFAADLTDAAYAVALRHGIAGSWIDLQLDVWRVIARTIAEEERESSPPAATTTEFNALRDAFLSELTQAVYDTALRHQLQGPFLDVELDLHEALRRVFERPESATAIRRMCGVPAQVMANAVLSRLDRRHSGYQSSNPAAAGPVSSDRR
jgi:hypothetical protein